MDMLATTSGIREDMNMEELELEAHNWHTNDVVKWARHTGRCRENMIHCLQSEQIDGEVLLSLTEADVYDFRYRFNHQLTFSELKKFWFCVNNLQQQYYTNNFVSTPQTENTILLNKPRGIETTMATTEYCNNIPYSTTTHNHNKPSCMQHQVTRNRMTVIQHAAQQQSPFTLNDVLQLSEANGNNTTCRRSCSSPCSGVSSKNIPPEYFKTLISLGYSFLVTWITSFVMVIVHERVPDMKRYPPLPDIFLDNVPHIPWAFHMCEITGTLLFAIWFCVIIFHKYRTVLLRRFFALAGTVFLLRCVTMLITSLSVPGTHLQCDQTDLAVDDAQLSFGESLEIRIMRAYIIWSGLGMSIQGVRTCGDYMFSGHTVALTLLNFFITEYTPRNLYFLHTLTWLLNMFGIFFILAAHEHYSIDVFVAFYITSRLFLYYHTLANNQALMSQDSTRTRVWFPMFSYFESSVEGIVPNEYDSMQTILSGFLKLILSIKDACMLTGRRIWLHPPQLPYIPRMQARKFFNMPRVSGFTTKRMSSNAATSTSTISNLKTPSSTTISSNSSHSLMNSYWPYKSNEAAKHVTPLEAPITTTTPTKQEKIEAVKKFN